MPKTSKSNTLTKADILYTLKKYNIKHDSKSSVKSLKSTLTKAKKAGKVKKVYKKPKRSSKLLQKKYKTMSDKRYKNLLSKKRLSKTDRTKLEKELHSRFCHCIKRRLVGYSDSYPKSSAYAICTSSVYKNRGRNPPKGAARNCKKYSWYR